MATREIYETSFDEGIQMESSANWRPECDGWVTTNSVGTVYEGCGLVIDKNRIDHGPKWRSFDEDERKRAGAPLTTARHDRGLSTEIGRSTDADSNELSGQKQRQMARMRHEQSHGRFQSKAERSLAYGLDEIRRVASVPELSDLIRDQACQLFRSAQNEDLLRGQSIEAIAAASVYGACRCNGHSRLLDDVVNILLDDNLTPVLVGGRVCSRNRVSVASSTIVLTPLSSRASLTSSDGGTCVILFG